MLCGLVDRRAPLSVTSAGGWETHRGMELEAALRGDEEAFRRLVEPHRDALHAHCYRMLGSLHDAEDALEETLLRCWRALARFDRSRPLRPWLFRIATNVCMNALARRSKRVLSLDVRHRSRTPVPASRSASRCGWSPTAAAGGRLRGTRERRAGVRRRTAAPRPRAARRADPARCPRLHGARGRRAARHDHRRRHSSLERARSTLAHALPDRTQQATRRALGDAACASCRALVAAWERRDVDALVAILAEDVTFAMPRIRTGGAGATTSSAPPCGPGSRAAQAPHGGHGQPAVAWYVRDTPGGPYVGRSIEVLAFDGERVSAIVAFASRGCSRPSGCRPSRLAHQPLPSMRTPYTGAMSILARRSSYATCCGRCSSRDRCTKHPRRGTGVPD